MNFLEVRYNYVNMVKLKAFLFIHQIPVILYHGSQEERLRMRSKLEKPVTVEGNISAFPVVVTSYEICMRDQKSMYSLDWKYIIVDEGHRIKNLNCKLIR